MTKMTDESRKFTANQRKKLAGGAAMSDGSFPIQNKEDLKNAIQAFGRAKNKARAKAHIISRARALGATSLLPDGWIQKKADKADDMVDTAPLITCPEEGCGRSFIDAAALHDHADSVHTYDEIQRAVSKEVRKEFARQGSLGTPSVYAWVMDLSDTWVVFTIENGDGENLFQCDYTMDDSGKVTLGEPRAVLRKIVYVPAPKDD